MPSRFDVIARLYRTFDVVFQRRQGPDALVRRRILGRDLPNPDLPVLVAGEDPVVGDYNGLDQPGVGLEPGIFPLVLPDPDVLAVRPGVEQLAGGGEGVYVALLADEGAHEDVGEVVVRRRDVGHVAGPGGLGEGRRGRRLDVVVLVVVVLAVRHRRAR